MVLDLGLDIFNGVKSFHFTSDGLACTEDLDEDPHITMQAKHQVKGDHFGDVVVTQGTAIFKLLATKDQALLVWGDARLVLDHGLDIFNGAGSFHVNNDGTAS